MTKRKKRMTLGQAKALIDLCESRNIQPHRFLRIGTDYVSVFYFLTKCLKIDLLPLSKEDMDAIAAVSRFDSLAVRLGLSDPDLNSTEKQARSLSQFIGTDPIFDLLSPSEQERLKELCEATWERYEELGGSR